MSARSYAVIGLLLVLGAASGAYAYHAKAVARDNARAADAQKAEQVARVEGLKRKLAAQSDAVRAARDAAARADNELDRAAANKALASALVQQRNTEAELAAAEGRALPPVSRVPAAVGCGCDAGDPDCSML